MPNTDETESAFCKLCRQSIIPKASNLNNHARSDKHINKNVNAANSSKPLPLQKVRKDDSMNVKIFEIVTVVGIARHNAVRSVDHLGGVMKWHGEGSTVGNIRLNRTKCTKILTRTEGREVFCVSR